MAKSKKTDGRAAELAFMDALFRLVQACPPEGFNIIGFQLLGASGRLFDATELVNKYVDEILAKRQLDEEDRGSALVLSPFGDRENNQVVVTRIPFNTEILTFQDRAMRVGFNSNKLLPVGWYRTKLCAHRNATLQAIDVFLLDKNGETINVSTVYRDGKLPYHLTLPNDYLAARVAAGEGEMIPPVISVDAAANQSAINQSINQ